jgi:hypothetical protein
MVSAITLVAATSVFAAVPLTSTVTVTPGVSTGSANSVTLLGGGTSSMSGSTGVALVPISQFNPNSGILLGARLTATVPVSVTTVVTSTVPQTGSDRRATASTTYTGAVTSAGASIPGSAITSSVFCTAGNCANSPNNGTNVVTGSISGNAAVASGSLGSYYGTGNVNVATAGSVDVSITNQARVTSGTGTGTIARTAGSTYSLAYDYLNFAQPSFNGSTVQSALTIDFGTLVLNSGSSTINFTLYNIGNQNSAGFDVISVTPENGNPLFSTTLAPFTNSVAGGASRSFSATFDPNTLGGQIDKLRIIARDSAADVGNGIGAREYVLELSLAGLVALPDPATWMTMIAGFGLVGGVMRRRRAIAA